MLKTRRWKMIDGRRKFIGFDQLLIDPMESQRVAREHIDRTEVNRLYDEYISLEWTEENFIKKSVLKKRLETAQIHYILAVNEYAKKNPIHFHPREGEEIYCPLIENAKQRIKRNDPS